MSKSRLISQQLASLIVKRNAAPPTNSPPVWDTQPNPMFIQGTASNYTFADKVSDPNFDSVDVTLNTGAVSLPSGVTYNGTLDRLEYDGIGALNATSGHIATADDGTDTTDSNAFGISITAWPAYGAHAQAGVNVSGWPTNYETDPYRTWNSKKDLIFAQHRYPNSTQVAAEIAATDWMRTQNSNIKMAWYVFSTVISTNTSSAKYLGREVMNNNGALSDWTMYDKDGGGQLEYSNEVAGSLAANTNYEHASMPAGSQNANFSIGFWSLVDSKYGGAFPWDVLFFDSTDYQDAFPRWRLSSDGTTLGDPDYVRPWSFGDTDPANFRNGIKYDVGRARAILLSNMVVGGNGGRDGDVVNEDIGDNEWADFWDFRLAENCQQKLGLVTDNGTANEFEVQYANPDSRVAILMEAALVSEAMVDQTSGNRLGKGTVILDFVMDWSGTAPTTIAGISQDHYEAARFITGISMLHDSFVPAPNLTRGVYAFPYLDELVYDPGNPVGGTPSFGTIDTPRNTGVFTARAADQAATSGIYGVYWQEFDNVLWVVNLNEPTGSGAAWPQATEDTITLPDPDIGGGEVWRFADSSYSNGSRTTGATDGEDQSPLINDGSLTGATIDMPRWTARMLVRSAS